LLEGRLSPAVLTVSTLADGGAGSLRQAITDANNAAGDDVIQFAPGLRGTISLASALPGPTSNVAIQGPGAKLLSVQESGPLFNVLATVSISGLTFTGGGNGDFISNAGDLTLQECAVIGVNASFGSTLSNSGTLTLDRCTVANNAATFGGVGGVSNTGTLVVSNSTIAGNHSVSPFSTAVGGFPGPAGILNRGTLTITSSTVTGNDAVPGRGPTFGLGAGILNDGGTVTIGSTIVAQNGVTSLPPFVGPATGQDVHGAFISRGYNLIGDGTGSAGFGATGDRVGTGGGPLNAELGPLQDNGGPTPTMAPLSGSLAIDGGDPASALATDQNGASRPQDGDGDGAARPDVGAVEAAAGTSRLHAPLVAALYRDLLGRRVDPGGEAHWLALLDGGGSSMLVAQGIVGSPEYREHVVRGLYQSLLNREADPTGLAAFSARLAQGESIAALEASFLGSAEYAQSFSSSDSFLASLYQAVLARGIDPTGQAGLSAALAAGVPRQVVALAVLQSDEAHALLVGNDYQGLLRRAADPAGQTGFVAQLQRGAREVDVALGMAGSAEYAALFLG
jgi:hypothetical protein